MWNTANRRKSDEQDLYRGGRQHGSLDRHNQRDALAYGRDSGGQWPSDDDRRLRDDRGAQLYDDYGSENRNADYRERDDYGREAPYQESDNQWGNDANIYSRDVPIDTRDDLYESRAGGHRDLGPKNTDRVFEDVRRGELADDRYSQGLDQGTVYETDIRDRDRRFKDDRSERNRDHGNMASRDTDRSRQPHRNVQADRNRFESDRSANKSMAPPARAPEPRRSSEVLPRQNTGSKISSSVNRLKSNATNRRNVSNQPFRSPNTSTGASNRKRAITNQSSNTSRRSGSGSGQSQSPQNRVITSSLGQNRNIDKSRSNSGSSASRSKTTNTSATSRGSNNASNRSRSQDNNKSSVKLESGRNDRSSNTVTTSKSDDKFKRPADVTASRSRSATGIKIEADYGMLNYHEDDILSIMADDDAFDKETRKMFGSDLSSASRSKSRDRDGKHKSTSTKQSETRSRSSSSSSRARGSESIRSRQSLGQSGTASTGRNSTKAGSSVRFPTHGNKDRTNQRRNIGNIRTSSSRSTNKVSQSPGDRQTASSTNLRKSGNNAKSSNIQSFASVIRKRSLNNLRNRQNVKPKVNDTKKYIDKGRAASYLANRHVNKSRDRNASVSGSRSNVTVKKSGSILKFNDKRKFKPGSGNISRPRSAHNERGRSGAVLKDDRDAQTTASDRRHESPNVVYNDAVGENVRDMEIENDRVMDSFYRSPPPIRDGMNTGRYEDHRSRNRSTTEVQHGRDDKIIRQHQRDKVQKYESTGRNKYGSRKYWDKKRSRIRAMNIRLNKKNSKTNLAERDKDNVRDERKVFASEDPMAMLQQPVDTPQPIYFIPNPDVAGNPQPQYVDQMGNIIVNPEMAMPQPDVPLQYIQQGIPAPQETVVNEQGEQQQLIFIPFNQMPGGGAPYVDNFGGVPQPGQPEGDQKDEGEDKVVTGKKAGGKSQAKKQPLSRDARANLRRKLMRKRQQELEKKIEEKVLQKLLHTANLSGGSGSHTRASATPVEQRKRPMIKRISPPSAHKPTHLNKKVKLVRRAKPKPEELEDISDDNGYDNVSEYDDVTDDMTEDEDGYNENNRRHERGRAPRSAFRKSGQRRSEVSTSRTGNQGTFGDVRRVVDSGTGKGINVNTNRRMVDSSRSIRDVPKSEAERSNMKITVKNSNFTSSSNRRSPRDDRMSESNSRNDRSTRTAATSADRKLGNQDYDNDGRGSSTRDTGQVRNTQGSRQGNQDRSRSGSHDRNKGQGKYRQESDRGSRQRESSQKADYRSGSGGHHGHKEEVRRDDSRKNEGRREDGSRRDDRRHNRSPNRRERSPRHQDRSRSPMLERGSRGVAGSFKNTPKVDHSDPGSTSKHNKQDEYRNQRRYDGNTGRDAGNRQYGRNSNIANNGNAKADKYYPSQHVPQPLLHFGNSNVPVDHSLPPQQPGQLGSQVQQSMLQQRNVPDMSMPPQMMGSGNAQMQPMMQQQQQFSQQTMQQRNHPQQFQSQYQPQFPLQQQQLHQSPIQQSGNMASLQMYQQNANQSQQGMTSIGGSHIHQSGQFQGGMGIVEGNMSSNQLQQSGNMNAGLMMNQNQQTIQSSIRASTPHSFVASTPQAIRGSMATGGSQKGIPASATRLDVAPYRAQGKPVSMPQSILKRTSTPHIAGMARFSTATRASGSGWYEGKQSGSFGYGSTMGQGQSMADMGEEEVVDDTMTELLCSKCDKIFLNEGAMRKHKKWHDKMLKEDNDLRCDICEQAFVSKTLFDNHSREKHNLDIWSCNLCDINFSDANLLEYHFEHTNHQPTKLLYSCSLCPANFMTIGYLVQHKKAHHAQYAANNSNYWH